jgi:hypothetical protein
MRIRRLTLRGRPLTEDKCHTLSDSPLVNDMATLRALYLLDENIDEGLIQWLREHLPPSCVCSAAEVTTSVAFESGCPSSS